MKSCHLFLNPFKIVQAIFTGDAESQVKAAAAYDALKGTDVEEIKKKTQDLVQASMKLGEAIYKSQQSTKPGDTPKDAKDEGKKDDNVVEADFEEVNVVNFYNEVKWYFPKMKNNQLISTPLTNGKQPSCAFFVKDISRQCESIEYTQLL